MVIEGNERNQQRDPGRLAPDNPGASERFSERRLEPQPDEEPVAAVVASAVAPESTAANDQHCRRPVSAS
jgi:hypothetical protein